MYNLTPTYTAWDRRGTCIYMNYEPENGTVANFVKESGAN